MGQIIIWVKVFKNEPSEICGGEPLKNFTCSILECFGPFEDKKTYLINEFYDLLHFLMYVHSQY